MRMAMTVGAVLLSTVAWAGETKIKESEVPRPVMDALKAKYPAAKAIGFEREEEGAKVVYEIKLSEGKRALEVTFDAAGKIVEEGEGITVAARPPPVKSAGDGST